MTCREEKAARRKELLALRRAMPKEEHAALDAALVAHIAAHPYFLNADALLGFFAMRGEPDLSPLYRMAMARGVPVYLPRVKDGEMRFYRFEGEDALTPDDFGVLSPSEAAEVVPTTRTLCLLPGLAADKSGVRLGYGGGFYDRFLPSFTGKVIFPLYSRFLVERLPAEPTDCLIACIITEKGEETNV